MATNCVAVQLIQQIATADLTLFGTVHSQNIGKKSARKKDSQLGKVVESQALFLPVHVILFNPYNLGRVVFFFPCIIVKLNLTLHNLFMVT